MRFLKRTLRRLPPFAVFLICALAAGFALRAPRLAERPMHADEAVHAVKLGTLLETGVYLYDPHEYHGPTIYYAALPGLRALGAARLAEIPDAAPLRAVPLLFGLLLIAAPALLRGVMGRRAALIAAAGFAVSPAFVYYSRYYIQELPFVCLAVLFTTAAWRWWSERRVPWAVAAGVLLGLMIATKETWVLHVGATAAAAGATALWMRRRGERADADSRAPHRRHVGVALGTALLVGGLLLSNFLRNPAAWGDLFGAFLQYAHRAATGEGSHGAVNPHVHPWTFYAQRLFWFHRGPGPRWSEAAIGVLALAGWIAALRGRATNPQRRTFALWVAFSGMALAVVYSALPYKTPWLALNVLAFLTLSAGLGADALLRVLPRRWMRFVAGALLCAAAAHLALQARAATGRFAADPRNPWVYAHTSTDLARLTRRIEQIEAVAGRPPVVKVFAPHDDYWPLPWALRAQKRVGWWSEVPPAPDADVIVSSPALEDGLTRLLTGEYVLEYVGLRPEVLLQVRIRRDLWKAFLARQGGAP